MVKLGILLSTYRLATSKNVLSEVLTPGWRTYLAAFTIHGSVCH